MRKVILRFIALIAILYVTSNIVIGFNPNSFGSLLFLALLLTVSHFTINPVIRFLTLPLNYLTLGIFHFIISCALIYLFNFIIAGFSVTAGSLGPVSSDVVNIPTIKLSQIGVFIVSAIMISFLNNLISWTQE
jgi:putative membrane protein